jgi:RNA polymerase sigma-70 factor (ECF subfamily)
MDDDAGIQRAFLVDRHDLMAYLRALCRSEAEAEDLFQDTWLALTDALREGRPVAHVPAWSRTVARRLWLKRIRALRRERPGDEAIATALAEVLDAHPADEDRTRMVDALRACLGRLERGTMSLLDRRYGDDLPMTDLAEELGISMDNLCVRLSRARRRLRACIERRLAESAP